MPVTEKNNTHRSDTLTRFIFEQQDIRGELVYLKKTYQEILNCQDYPVAIQLLLGELLVATSLLTATLKFEGDITVQLQGDGPLQFAVINGDDKQRMRGLARFNAEIANNATLHELLGKSIMVITITPNQGERYQGIVPLEGETLSDCLELYFKQSEQLSTKLVLRVGVTDQMPFASGLLLQTLPTKNTPETALAFENLSVLASTLKTEELATLSAHEILHRLYHEEEVRLFQGQSVQFQCRCSRKRCEETLIGLPKEEIDTILKEDGEIDMTCDYCNTKYIFDSIDVEHLRTKQTQNAMQ